MYIYTFAQPFVQYLLSPSIVAALVLFVLTKMMKIGEVRKDFQIIKEDVGELKIKSDSVVTNITVIKTHLVEKAGVNAALFKTMSPITLTPKGMDIVQQVGFDTFISKNESMIFKYFHKEDITTLLHIDEMSDVVVNDLFESKKLEGYENEAFHRGISLEVLLRACSLYLREHMAKKLHISQ